MVARTLEVAPGEIITVMNNSIHYRVFYKGRFIAGPCIQSTSFEGIQNPEIYILAPINFWEHEMGIPYTQREIYD